MSVFETIKQRRKQVGITQEDLADISGVGLATVKDIERGKGNPSLETLNKICETLGLEVKVELKRIKL